ncbi:unnamed protein product [Penicillium olsonii]|uniref:Zn(2)-C6 fungal-type domain-containing protein n=1 Tax=Penicillium olsonii TaxID=99116 RepID=A0A9W4N249_PENOL|nr:unnamed protein product [Penicillium olsonii]
MKRVSEILKWGPKRCGGRYGLRGSIQLLINFPLWPRRVKCDEKPGKCDNCSRLRLVCSGYTTSPRPPAPGDASSSDRSKRKRTYRSCTGCRASKTKCSGERPTCQRCRDKEARCVYAESSQPTWVRKINIGATNEPEFSPSVTSSPARSSEQRKSSQDNLLGLADASPPPQPQQQQPCLLVENSELLPSSLDWLATPHLPSPPRIRTLVDEYFNNIHPLRAFTFIHKPTFLQTLDGKLSQDYQSHALLHIMCALGAQFFALNYSESVQALPPRTVLFAGKQWARVTQRLILEALDTVTIENLMAAVLLHDYAVRLGHFANAFMLSGITTRMTQALQINLEYNTDILCRDDVEGLSVTEKESRRRLMWSCYVMDALVGSGVDQLTLMDERDIKIQLPCNERNFTQQLPCLTETLSPGSWLKILPGHFEPHALLPNMGMMAYFIRHISIRKRVLRYIKHLGDAIVPWDPKSEFSALDSDCRAWYASLPPSLQFTQAAVYIRKDTSQLGALCLLHCAHYQTICDLYRLGAPALYKLRAAFDFPPEQRHFLRHLQQVLFDAARSLASIIGETARHGPRMLADSWLPTILYDSCRIMIYHLTQILDPESESTKSLIVSTIPLLRDNIKGLRLMGSLNSIANSLSCSFTLLIQCSAAETMLDRSGIESEIVRQNIIPDDPYQPNQAADPSELSLEPPVQSAPDYVLNPLTIFRMARKSIPERHAPETVRTSSAPSSIRHDQSDGFDPPSCEASNKPGPGDTCIEQSLGQASLEELQTLFMSDLGWAWQPSDTAVGSGTEGAGLLPWAGGNTTSQVESWLPVFPFPHN